MRKAVALTLIAAFPLAACVASSVSQCEAVGQPGSAAYQACMQAAYARAMQEMDYQAWLELRKGQMGTR